MIKLKYDDKFKLFNVCKDINQHMTRLKKKKGFRSLIRSFFYWSYLY